MPSAGSRGRSVGTPVDAMHEEALLKDLRRKIEEIAAAQAARRITRIVLWVGALSHFTEEHLREDWSRVVSGTPAEGAALEVECSNDLNDPRAQKVVLVRVGVE